MEKSCREELFRLYQQADKYPSMKTIENWLDRLFHVLYPYSTETRIGTQEEFDAYLEQLEADLRKIICKDFKQQTVFNESICAQLFKQLLNIKKVLDTDIDAIYKGDPAAKSREEVILCYPGFYAVVAHRIAHFLYQKGAKLIPRLISEMAHNRTGIDIHPGATIGSHFCIDHGTGIVIGETCQIGNHVKIYQGVTLGGLSVNKADANVKRHPTIEDHVIIYAGATILGGKTIIGEGTIIGGNTFITKSVAAHSKIYYSAK